MFTWPFWMNGSRLADTVSVHLILSASMPSLPAMILAISTSKPSGFWACGLSRPKPGWSNLVPTVMVPASCSWAMVEPAGNFTFVSTAAVFFDCWDAWFPAWLEQPASRMPAAAAASAAYRVMRMVIPSESVVEDLGQEVLGPSGSGVGEEGLRLRRLDDAAGVHEDDAVGCAPGETHLVRDDDHRHAVVRQ